MPETLVVHAPTGDLPVPHFVPERPNGAAVVVVLEIFRVSDYIVGRCQGVTASGCLDWDTATNDVAATVAALRTEPGVGKVGLLGFAFQHEPAKAAAWPVTVDFLAAHLVA